MKKMIVLGALMACVCSLSALEGPSVYKMSEGQLLEVAKSGALDDRMTACQELAHRGTAASVPVLADMLGENVEPALFHAALYALQGIPGAEADAALATAEAKASGARRAAIAHVRAARAGKVFALEGYAGATEALIAFPPKTDVQKGDLAALPALVDAAAGTGPEATLARFQLAGFPNPEADARLMEMARGADEKKARLALRTLGERRARAMLPQMLELARATKDERLRVEAFKALAQAGDAKRDLFALLALLAEMPEEERLAGAIVRMASNEFLPESKPVKVIEAKFGNFDSRRVADVKLMADSLIEAGAREVMAGCRLVGRGGFHRDPAPGMTKELRIAYSVGDGPVQRTAVPDSTMLSFGESVLPDCVARPIVEAALRAKGPARAALAGIVGALERRGRVPGSDAVLFRPIFNGTDLAGWKQEGDFFSAKDGVLVAESTAERPCGKGRYLVYEAEQLADFELRGSFRLGRSANSGFQLRSKPDLLKDTGYQADMNGSGGYVGFLYCTGQHLVGERGADVTLAEDGRKRVDRFADSKELQQVYRVGEWNDIRVVAKGRILAVWINGVRTVAVADARRDFLPDSGYISIQLHPGPPMKAEFRDLRIRTDEVSLDANLENTLLRRMEDLAMGDAPSLEGADWIWHANGQKQGAKVAFRAEFDLPQGEIEKAGLVFSCDDSAVFSVNGREVARQTDGKLWYTPTAVLDLKRSNLSPGRNLIEVAAENNVSCAAFIAVMEVTYRDGRIVRLPTGVRGRKASLEGGPFGEPSMIGTYGCSPYGKFNKDRN